jgi:hypothetical protein
MISVLMFIKTMTKFMDTFPSYLTPFLPNLLTLINGMLPQLMPVYQSISVLGQDGQFTVPPGWEGIDQNYDTNIDVHSRRGRRR